MNDEIDKALEILIQNNVQLMVPLELDDETFAYKIFHIKDIELLVKDKKVNKILKIVK